MKKYQWIVLVIVGALGAYAVGSYLFNRLTVEDSLQKINNIQGVETCQSISPRSYVTFLIFSTPDHQTYYYQSECFQRVAVEQRDDKLCDQVRERKSLFFNGSGVSREACLADVSHQKSQDSIDRSPPAGVHEIENLSVETTPTGDFEVEIVTSGKLAGSYDYTISVLDPSGKNLGVVSQLDTSINKVNKPLPVTVSKEDIENLLLSNGKSGQEYYYIQASLRLIQDDAGQLELDHVLKSRLETRKIKKILL